jgi:ArsR family transcriptional regulator
MKIDRMFRAFADETRLRILHALAGGELCVCDIMKVLGAPQSKVSRHLGYLKRAGLVSDRRDSLWRYYALAEPRSRFHETMIGCIGACFREVPALKKDARRLAALKKSGIRRC